MKILFDYHCPFSFVHGGFHVQIEQTFQALREIGVHVDWLRFWDDSQRADIIHFFGKPYSSYLQYAHAQGIKTVFNELHTDLGSRPALQRNIQSLLIKFLKSTCPPIARRMDWKRFDLADVIIALTPYEASLIRDVFHAPADRIRILSNGVEEHFLKNKVLPRQDWLLCVASIHPRKRVLELATAASAARIPLRICGAPSPETNSYFLKFQEILVRSGGVVRWEGKIEDRGILADIYRQARGFVLLSECETLSLSALEAAATGCPLLLSDLPWATTTFGKNAFYTNPKIAGKRLGETLRIFASQSQIPYQFHVPTWIEVAQSLKGIYEELLSTRD